MDTNIKIAGTTYHPLPPGKMFRITDEFIKDGIPCAHMEAVLQPEPENQYDPEAVKVIVPLSDGSAFHLGYLPMAEPLKAKVKAILPAKIAITDYRQVGNYSPSFLITSIQADLA